MVPCIYAVHDGLTSLSQSTFGGVTRSLERVADRCRHDGLKATLDITIGQLTKAAHLCFNKSRRGASDPVNCVVNQAKFSQTLRVVPPQHAIEASSRSNIHVERRVERTVQAKQTQTVDDFLLQIVRLVIVAHQCRSQNLSRAEQGKTLDACHHVGHAVHAKQLLAGDATFFWCSVDGVESATEHARQVDDLGQSKGTERQDHTAQIGLVQARCGLRQNCTVDVVVQPDGFFSSSLETLTLLTCQHERGHHRDLAVEPLRVLEDVAHDVIDLVERRLIAADLGTLGLAQFLFCCNTDHTALRQVIEEGLHLACSSVAKCEVALIVYATFREHLHGAGHSTD